MNILKHIFFIVTMMFCLLKASSFDDDTLTQFNHKIWASQETLDHIENDLTTLQNIRNELRIKQVQAEPNTNLADFYAAKATAKWEEWRKAEFIKNQTTLRLELYENLYAIRQSLLDMRSKPELKVTLTDSLLKNSQKLISQINQYLSRQNQLVDKLQKDILDTNLNSESTLSTSDFSLDFKSSKKAMQGYLNLKNKWISELKEIKTIAKNQISEIELYNAKGSFREQGKSIWYKIVSLWNLEITRSSDKPITLGKLILALFISIIGIKVARFAAIFMSKFGRKKLELDHGVADASQKLMFYTFSVLFVLYALYLVQFPLTAFTFAGGAIAIGVGFGSQTLMNNFISGLILLIERPVKTGDFVEVDDIIGTVDSIGLRSTLVRTAGNVHLVLPNSSFLEKKVTNWTLSDRMVRQELSVGVAYGSDTQKVAKLLLKATSEIKAIKKDPEPIVVFSDFGDNALAFEVIFWIQLDRLIQRRLITSSLRFAVDRIFNEEGVIIAFPQRDLHIDTTKPIEIELKHPPKIDPN